MAETTTEPKRSRSVRRNRFSIVSLIPTVYAPAFLLAVGQGVLIPVLPVFAKDEFLATEALIGLAVGAKHLGTLAFDVPAGILVSRFGMWRTMLVGILLFAVAAVAAANSPNFGLLFISRFAAGASFAFWMISRHAFIAGAVPTRHRGKALSLYGGVGRIAAIIGPILGGVLAEYVDIRAPFYVQAVIAVMTGILVLYAMKRSGGDSVDPQGHRNVVASIGSTMVLHRKDFMTAGLVAVILQFIRAAREFLIPVWGDEMGLKTDQIGYVASVSYAVDSTMFP
ncbi:MAG: MFS transporter, partial [Chloroflexi bacterium]|nr:MFS transporter [Chloroflexota bacterium]